MLSLPIWLRQHANLLALVIASIPALIKMEFFPHYIGSDDAYIHLTVARNLAQGLGWGINPHQPVNLSTAPAFTLMLAAAERFSTHPVGIVQILSYLAVVIGLLAIYAAVVAETSSSAAGLLSETTAAFSNNLWRWNGTLMETTFAFSIVSATLYLLRRGKKQTPRGAIRLGLILGLGVLMRPEIGMLCIFAAVVLALRTERRSRKKLVSILLLTILFIFLTWVIVARTVLKITVIPTTLAAKSVHGLIAWNPRVLEEFALSHVESCLIPALLVGTILFLSWKGGTWRFGDWASYVLPLTWVLGLLAFYYFKTRNLESAGRYLLPLLPAEAVLIALVWKGAMVEKNEARRAAVYMVTVGALAFNAVFALAVNQMLISPVLRRFENEYLASMRAAAMEIAGRTAGLHDKKVLILYDIGVLSYASEGKFEIFDGGSLASPDLYGLSVTEKVSRVEPSIVVETLEAFPQGGYIKLPESFKQVWSRRFFRHSIGAQQPYYYVILFQRQ